MSKRDDDNDEAGRYDAGDLIAGIFLGASAAALGVGAMLLRSPRRAPAGDETPAPVIAVEERGARGADTGGAVSVGDGLN